MCSQRFPQAGRGSLLAPDPRLGWKMPPALRTWEGVKLADGVKLTVADLARF